MKTKTASSKTTPVVVIVISAFLVMTGIALIGSLLRAEPDGARPATASATVTATSATTTPSERPTATGTRSVESEPVVFNARIVRVVDGDTAVIGRTGDSPLPALGEDPADPDVRTVRLIGIDAPETQDEDGRPECGAIAARNHLGGILPMNLPVVFEFDPRSDRIDQYGRLLGYLGTPTGDDAGSRQVTDGYASPWYPEDEPEPVMTGIYETVVRQSVAERSGLRSQCETVGRSHGPRQ